MIAVAGWRSWWWVLALLSLAMGLWLLLALPASCDRAEPGATASIGARTRQTLSAPGPWLAAGLFALYSGQWLAVIGFLPSVYAQAGVAGAWAAVATSLAAGVNMVGNIASGRLLQRGAPAQRLLRVGFAAMALGALLAFAPWWSALPGPWGAALRYAGVLLFSMVGGMVPGTLFSVAVRLAPGASTISTTVGWMQQWSSAGQFLGPPVVAWMAARSGGWDWVWLVTGACALAGIALAGLLPALLRANAQASRATAGP